MASQPQHRRQLFAKSAPRMLSDRNPPRSANAISLASPSSSSGLLKRQVDWALGAGFLAAPHMGYGAMKTLLCFGLSYTAQHYLAAYGARFEQVWGTVRDQNRAAELNARAKGNMRALTFGGTSVSDDLQEAAAQADAILVSIPPDERGDPVLAVCGSLLTHSRQIRTIVYLSTIGVYGNHDGAWIDENADCRPSEQRNRQRLMAERGWQGISARSGLPVAILRLAGIYGPGRNALENLQHGTAKRICKPGHVFNRIHVADIAQAIDAAFDRRANGIFNIADDEPSPPGDPIAYAAKLLGFEPPPKISFDQARSSMNEMAASFYLDVKRVSNVKLKTVLGVKLTYPTYREGLSALMDAG
jgi:nucleoside-diphosphate-sugar epimerase